MYDHLQGKNAILLTIGDRSKRHPFYPGQLAPFSDDLSRVIFSGIQKDPRKRQASCGEVKEELLQIQKEGNYEHSASTDSPTDSHKAELRRTYVRLSGKADLAEAQLDELEALEGFNRHWKNAQDAKQGGDVVGSREEHEKAGNFLMGLPKLRYKTLFEDHERLEKEFAGIKPYLEILKGFRVNAMEIKKDYMGFRELLYDEGTLTEMTGIDVAELVKELGERANEQIAVSASVKLPGDLGSPSDMFRKLLPDIMKLPTDYRERKKSYIEGKRTELRTAVVRGLPDAPLKVTQLERAVVGIEADFEPEYATEVTTELRRHKEELSSR